MMITQNIFESGGMYAIMELMVNIIVFLKIESFIYCMWFIN